MRTVFRTTCFAAVIAAAMAALVVAPSYAAHPFPVALKGYDGATIGAGDNVPYSPKQSCGTCHDYNLITRGYHFQQGRTDAAGTITVTDTYNPAKPWILSAGMYGKW